MYPLYIFCGNVIRPGCEEDVPFSKVGFVTVNTNPFEAPSVPGQGSVPAPDIHVAEHALDAKSYTVPVVEDVLVATGVAVRLAVLETTISTHHDFVPAHPNPNGIPLLSLNFQ